MKTSGLDKRASALPEHSHVAAQRAVPAVFVIDDTLRVLHYRADPHERRRDCVYEPQTQRLPELIERSVRTLLEEWRAGESSSLILSAVPNASIMLRMLPLEGGARPVYAVLVERFKMRAGLRAVAERYSLSKREHEALALVVKGAKNAEIASRLQIAPSTAIFHVKQLMAKTGARNRTELVAKVVG